MELLDTLRLSASPPLRVPTHLTSASGSVSRAIYASGEHLCRFRGRTALHTEQLQPVLAVVRPVPPYSPLGEPNGRSAAAVLWPKTLSASPVSHDEHESGSDELFLPVQVTFV